jgi:hypothetical protein
MGGQTIDLTALYRAPVTLFAQQGSARYHTTLASHDRLVLDLEDGGEAAGAEIGELVSIGCPDAEGWVTGEVRVVARRGAHGLVTTAPALRVAQRRSSHRVNLALHIDVTQLDEDEPAWATGETIDVSADGFAAQVPPVGIVAGDRLGARLTLPDGHVVAGEVDVVASGPLVRARWTVRSERDRERVAQAVQQADAG